MDGEHRGLSRRERRYVDEMSRPRSERWAHTAAALVVMVVFFGLRGSGAGGIVLALVMAVVITVTVVLADVVDRRVQRRDLG
ncbi:hypothetical protein [Nocardioides zeae]